LVISLIRFSDINNCVGVGDADTLLLLRIVYSFFSFFFFFLLFIPLSHQNLRSLLLSGNIRDRLKTLKQLEEWSLFVVDYFIRLSHLRSQNDSFSKYAKHCSEAVCTLLLHAASAVTAVACHGPADTWE